jgi:hypothetical protein
MAIKIASDSIVRVIRPITHKFNLDELNDHVEGFIEPVKIGPVWVMYDEEGKIKNRELNKVASVFFGVPIYGTVLVVPPHQLPADWDIMEPEDYGYTSEDIDSGFLLSLQTVLTHNRVFGESSSEKNIDTFSSRFLPKEEWVYQPPIKAEIDENTLDFYQQVYSYITENPESFSKNIILSDDYMIIRVEDPQDKEQMIEQMIDYFVSQEEYEKCAKLKQAIEL